MALTLQELKKLIEEEKLHYFEDPRRPALMMGFEGVQGRYQVLILLEIEGTFLQFRTLQYPRCPADHRSLLAVLKAIGHINYRDRLIKIGWDPSDGEIVVYADLWVQDGTVTQGQFQQMLRNYLVGLDQAHGRLQKTLETGEDPGQESPQELLKKLRDGLPPELRELVDKMLEGGPGPGGTGGAGAAGKPGEEGPDVSKI